MRIMVTGSSGFIGGHLVRFLKSQGHYVIGVDIKNPEFRDPGCDEFHICDLRSQAYFPVDQVYHLAADMGGIGYIETHKARIVVNNSLININTLKSCYHDRVQRVLFTSSACVYPGYLQNHPNTDKLKEEQAYPADAEDGYGWEKLMGERLCRHYMEDYGLETRIARLHNIYGPYGAYDGGREKSPAAICRKVAQAKNRDYLEIWGDGTRTRSYCYVDDCVEALVRLMNSDYAEPVNIGTDRAVTIDKLADIIIDISGKRLVKKYKKSKPKGVMGRNADISLAKNVLNWKPQVSLEEGLRDTYTWISDQLSSVKSSTAGKRR